MRRFTAVILFVLFHLGVFGVSIERHICCHAQQEESTTKHCNDDESCCGEDDDCRQEVVAQVKIAKDYTSQDSNINLELDHFVITASNKIYPGNKALPVKNTWGYATKCYFPPPKDFQILYSTFLI